VAIALAGTSRQEHVAFTTGTPVDALIAQLPEGKVERTFLLEAGAWAIYRQAGAPAQQADEVPAPAVDETLRECSPGAALLVSRLLSGEQDALLPETLARLSQQGLRLPFRLLPLALNATNKETRAALFPLLGERGRWLSLFNQSWKWVNNYLASERAGLPADAETIWQEGTPGQRIEILRRQRAIDPGKAREWLATVWKQEKAEVRTDLLDTLKIGLSPDDEPFLEKALDDRASGVRTTAANLLSSLPSSAFSERMRQRGQDMLQMVNGRVRIQLPAELEQTWQRDGIAEKPPHTLSKRGWWLIQTLAAIEPTFWETQFGASPATLLDLLPTDDVWRIQVIEGWSKAARNFQTLAWLEPLWFWWNERYEEAIKEHQLTEYGYASQLMQLMPGAMAERIVLRLIKQPDANQTSWSDLLSGLPRPWGSEFAQTYLHFLRESCTTEKIQEEDFNPYANPWLNTLPITALALPATCLEEASQVWDLSEQAKWQAQYATRQIKAFIETIHIRQKIYEEIH
jgi:hypothetical protein